MSTYSASAAGSAYAAPLLSGTRRRGGSREAIGAFAVTINVLLVVCLCEFSPQFQHWFVIPVALCGILAIYDALTLLARGMKIYEPATLVSVYGIYFFFVTPLLHIYLGYGVLFAPEQPDDWRPWLGIMAIFNFVGLILFKWVRDRFILRGNRARTFRMWLPRYNVLGPAFLTAFFVTAASQALVYFHFGGVGGFVGAFQNRTSSSFAGLGAFFSIGETFPIVSFIAICIFFLSRRRHVPMRTVTAMLAMVFVASVFCGGLRGSRTIIVSNVLWAAGVVHFTLRPLTRRAILAGSIVLLLFIYAYGFYKQYSTQAVQHLIDSSQTSDQASDQSARTVPSLLLGDLGRAGVQAYTLYRLWQPDSAYQYKWGSTYPAALALLIPSAYRPAIVDINHAGMDMAYGQGSFVAGSAGTTYVYGLAGEMMLNFTPWAIPVSFIVFGFIVGWAQKWFQELARGDLQWYIAPPIATLSLSVLTGSAGNVVYSVCTTLLLPMILLHMGSRRVVMTRAQAA